MRNDNTANNITKLIVYLFCFPFASPGDVPEPALSNKSKPITPTKIKYGILAPSPGRSRENKPRT